MRLSIASKLSLISAVFIAVTAASIITAFYLGGSHQLLESSLRQYNTLAQLEGRRLSEALHESIDDLHLISRLNSVTTLAEQLSSSDRETASTKQLRLQVEDEFFNMLRLHGENYRQLRLIDLRGHEQIRIDRNADGLQRIPQAQLQDKSNSEYVSATLRLPNGAPYFSKINLNREHGQIVEPHEPTLRIATPVSNSAGRKHGILVINIDIGAQLQHIRSSLGEISRYAYITNESGSYLSHHDHSLTFGFETSHDNRIQELLPELAPFFNSPMQEQVMMLPSENRAELALVFRKVRYDLTQPQRYISVGIAAPRDIILRDELSLIRRNIFWAVMLTITGIFTALILSIRITRPLNTLREATQRFMEKRESFTTPPPGNDEIARLGCEIKQLTDEVLNNESRLKNLNATLEQRIEERNRELVASQTMLETVLDALPNRIFWKDLNGNYLGCNRHFAADAGFDAPQQLVGKSDHEMPWAKHARDYLHDDRVVTNSGKSKLNIIESITLSDGSVGWLETHKLPLRNAEGEVIGILGSYQDITERRNAEIQLRHSEDRLRKSQQIAHVGNWDWNISDNTFHWSDEIYTIFGLRPQQFEATYQAFLDRIHPDDVERVSAAVDYSINNSGASYVIDHRIVRTDGEVRYVEEHGEVYRDLDGLPIRMIGVVHDITDNTLAQLALHREKERTERYLQISEAMIVELDTRGCISRINQRGCDLLGYRMSELLQCNWFDTVIPLSLRGEIKGVFEQLMQQPQQGDEPLNSYYENELVCRNGELITIAWHNIVNYDEHGHATGTLSSGQDITQRKQIERLKDEFISTVSHELRTPLTSIHGSLRLILGHVFGELPEKVRELLRVADNNSERLLTLINDLLDVQKIEAGMMEFNFDDISPDELLREAIENNHPFAAQHQITLKLNRKATKLPGHIYADHHRLMQVMNNLISNAIKFSPTGEAVEIVLGGNSQQIEIAVNDRGTGIPEQHREQLFDKFTQVDSSDTRQQGGTGLGLNIARLIVEQHQGSIVYHDNPGGGSSFRVTLPCNMQQG